MNPAQSCNVELTFTPSVSGHFITAFKLIDLGREIIKTSIVEGLGVEPVVTLSTTSINFGDQTVNQSSSAHEVLMTNSGNTDLAITSIDTTGVFTETDDCGNSLASQASCTLNVVFTPTAVQAFTGTVSITDDAIDSPQTISLSGNGVAAGTPDASLSTHNIDFGYVPEGTTSSAETITLTNSGNVNLNINNITASTNFGVSDDCGATLAPQATCTISATFTPPTAGNFSGTITVDDNASDSPQAVSLTGVGVTPSGPQVDVSTNQVDFGDETVGSTSNPQTITVTNGGGSDLEVQEIDLEGDGSHSYHTQDDCHGTTINPSGTCTISINFAPAVEGTLSAVISITDNASDSPQTIVISGNGVSSAGGGGGCSLMPRK